MVNIANLYIKNRITLKDIDFILKYKKKLTGKNPAVDWLLFEKRDNKTLDELFKTHSYKGIMKKFGKNKDDIAIINEYVVTHFKP